MTLKMRNKVLFTAPIVVVIAIAVSFALKPFCKKKAEAGFSTVKVEKGRITNSVTATGTIEAIKTVNVGTQVSGIVQHLYADFNDNVKQGQLLAKLDTTALKTQWDQSLATVNQAQAQLNYQEATYNRLKVLYDKKLISQADYDQALFNYENAKGSLSNAKSALARAKVNLDYATIYSPIDGVVLNRAVEEGQTVAASFNTPTLFTIVNDLTRMEVQTSVDEADIGKVKNGQRVEFTVDAYPDNKFEASVSEVRLQPVTTNNVVTYVVILNAPNPDKKLMPGMTASATIYAEERANTLILSSRALRFIPDTMLVKKMMAERADNRSEAGINTPLVGMTPQEISPGEPSRVSSGQSADMASSGILPVQMPGKKKMVWVRDERYGLRPNLVTTGIDNGTSVEILSGLNEGDEVIISMTTDTDKPSATGSGKAGRVQPLRMPGHGG
jgi:HlyD family secretion protein